MSLLGSATFAWHSDYGQFYLVDSDGAFQAPVEITAEMQARSLFVASSGLVIYTSDCLQQHIRIQVYDLEPAHAPIERMSGKPWTRVETAEVRLPTRRFTLCSPSMPDPQPAGPMFLVGSDTMMARIAWKEFQGSRDDSVPVEPDVIQIDLWELTQARPDRLGRKRQSSGSASPQRMGQNKLAHPLAVAPCRARRNGDPASACPRLRRSGMTAGE